MHRITSFFILSVACMIAASCAAAVAQESPEASDRPNILFLLSDDQQADAVGAYGNPYVDTPNLDRLVHLGFSFRGAYNMGSHHGAVCAPSRAMIMSGRSLFRVYDDLDDVPTMPELLGNAGYRTFGTGKWHQSRESFARSFEAGREVFFGGMSDHDKVPVRDLLPDGSFTDAVEKGFSSRVFADAAIEFLTDYGQGDRSRPFFAFVAFTTPHDPRTPPSPFLERYPPGGMPLPPNYLPVHPFDNGRLAVRDEVLAPWPRPTDVIRAQTAEYYGLITHMDEQIGRILDALLRQGLDENTLIIFTSDHGLALGRHGLLGKQNLYEHSAKSPLVVRGADVPHGSSDALVYLYDLFPTILGAAGVASPADVDGEDLSVIWSGERPTVRASLFTAYEDLQRAVRDGRWKLIRYPKIDHTQLFDLRTDPFELLDLSSDPAYAHERKRLMSLMRMWQQRSDDPHPLTADVVVPMEFDFEAVERVPDRHQPEIIRRKYFREE